MRHPTGRYALLVSDAVRPREAARDTIFDRQRATWRNERHAVGAQASTVEHQAVAASRGLFSEGGTF